MVKAIFFVARGHLSHLVYLILALQDKWLICKYIAFLAPSFLPYSAEAVNLRVRTWAVLGVDSWNGMLLVFPPPFCQERVS